MSSEGTPTLVTFRGGFVADWAVVAVLLDLEGRGATFSLTPGGGVRVHPAGLMRESELAFLRSRKAEVRAILAYQANDSLRATA
jgi:hypothetical protein